MIAKSKKSYEKSFLYTEADNNDIGYFVAYNLHVLDLSFKQLQGYLKRKQEEKKAANTFLQLGDINDVSQTKSRYVTFFQHFFHHFVCNTEKISIFAPFFSVKKLFMPLDNQRLIVFVKKKKEPTISFLRNRYNLSTEDCEDIFQDSLMVLYNRAVEGKINYANDSVSSFFYGICRNKAHEKIRENERNGVPIDPSVFELAEDEMEGASLSGFRNENIEKILALDSDTEKIRLRKEALVRKIVKNLPHPCEDIFWGVYRDDLSMNAMAQMLNKSEGYVKGTKHRCLEKFRNRYNELSAKIF